MIPEKEMIKDVIICYTVETAWISYQSFCDDLCSNTRRMSAAPQLRGLLASSTKFHAAGCFLVTAVSVLLCKHFVYDARMKRYEEFFKYVSANACILFYFSADSVLH